MTTMKLPPTPLTASGWMSSTHAGKRSRRISRLNAAALRRAWLPVIMGVILGFFSLVTADEVVEESVRDALLGKESATDDHDVNRDGKVDVADVLRLARLGARAQFVTGSTMARESTGLVTV